MSLAECAVRYLRTRTVKILYFYACWLSASNVGRGQHKESLVSTIYVSLANGQDSNSCGGKLNPCKTLHLALNTSSRDVHVYMDGHGTRKQPYQCQGFPRDRPAELLFRSIALESINEEAFISCLSGVHFKSPGLPSRLLLTNLTFSNTALEMDNFLFISVVNCKFLNNTKNPAAIQVHLSKENQNSSISIKETFFRHIKQSCIRIHKRMHASFNMTFPQLKILVSNTQFDANGNGDGLIGKRAAFYVTFNGHTHIHCEGIKFVKNHIPFLSFQQNTSRKNYRKEDSISVFIRNSIFDQNHSLNPNFKMFVIVIDTKKQRVHLSIRNTILTTNENGIKLTDFERLSFNNVTFHLTNGYSIELQHDKQQPTLRKRVISVAIKQCSFENNFESFSLKMRYSGQVSNWMLNVLIQKTNFYGSYPNKNFAAAIRIILLQNKEKALSQSLLHKPKISVIIKEVKIREIRGTALSLHFKSLSKYDVQVKRCLFSHSNNAENKHRESGPTVLLNFVADSSTLLKKTNKKRAQSHNINSTKNSRVVFSNTKLENNTGLGSVVLINNTDVTFVNSRFYENYALFKGATINVVDNGKSSLRFFNTTVVSRAKNKFHLKSQTQKTTCLLSFYSGTSLIIRNSSFTSDDDRDFYAIMKLITKTGVCIDKMSFIRCALGYQLKVDKFKGDVDFKKCEPIKRNCTTRAKNITSIKFYCQRCNYGFYSLERGRSRGLSVVKTSSCLPCPFGANCFQNIKAKTNFWGYKVYGYPSTLAFLPCPQEYCQRGNSKKNDYNSCYGNRTGVLCGKCAKGYTEALFLTKCHKENQCRNVWFWPLIAMYTTAMTLYFVYKPPIVSILFRNIFWFRESKVLHTIVYANDNGGVNVIFYFYQIAELVNFKSFSNSVYQSFIAPVTAGFNFGLQLFIHHVNCPFPGLTVVTKELFLSLNVFVVIALLLPVYAIQRLLDKARHRHCSHRQQILLYMAVAMEFLLLGYERLTETALKMLHCVPINNQLRLFYDGNVHCWQWWQFLFIIYTAVFVVPFIAVLYWASLKLQANEISNIELLFSFLFPLPFLIFWVIKHLKKIKTIVPEDDLEKTKEVFHNPFRPPSREHPGTLYWESVLIGRRFVLLCLYTFITDPMTKMMSLVCGNLGIFVHHMYNKPYKDQRINLWETASLLSLVILSTKGLIEASTLSLGVEPVGPEETHFKFLNWMEVLILGFIPTIFLILIILTVLSQMFRFGFFVVTVITHKTYSRFI